MLAMYAWDLCDACVALGFEEVQRRYEASLRKKVLVEPTPEGLKEAEEDESLPF
jgi:hypothetical protein